MNAALVPELDVSNLERSMAFYVDVCGFAISYERPAEAFAYLAKGDVEIMLQEATGPGRRFRTAPLEQPYGRGINLQMAIPDTATIYETACTAGADIVIPLEDRWYTTDRGELGNRQFVVADPDGYLLRFFEDLGVRSR